MRTLCLLLLSASVATADDGSQAIQDAINTLERKRVGVTDTARIDEAIRALREILKAPEKPFDLDHFIDNTAEYKGKIVTVEMEIESNIARGVSLADSDNSYIRFSETTPEGLDAVIVVRTPKGIKMPRAQTGERVVVTFRCTEGKASFGNIAIAVTRPKPSASRSSE